MQADEVNQTRPEKHICRDPDTVKSVQVETCQVPCGTDTREARATRTTDLSLNPGQKSKRAVKAPGFEPGPPPTP